MFNFDENKKDLKNFFSSNFSKYDIPEEDDNIPFFFVGTSSAEMDDTIDNYNNKKD